MTLPKQHLYTGGNDYFLKRLVEAVNHADVIHIAVSFIRSTGLVLLIEPLAEALSRGAVIKIVTGDYLQITEPQALRMLMLLQDEGADVRIFESRNSQSFHMKAYIFTNPKTSTTEEGYAFIGSSNMTQSALCHGFEWNLMVRKDESEERFIELLEKFQSLTKHSDVIPLTHSWIDSYQARFTQSSLPKSVAPGADEILPPPAPTPIQEDALEALYTSREKGYKRGLVVMATGLGKTWLAAFDTIKTGSTTLLFVAHREEIIDQAAKTFIRIRPEAKVGKYTGRQKDFDVDMLFASVQTIGQLNHLRKFSSSHFDYIVIDEFHHAAANTYQRLIKHFHPKFLLGLTATPERTDQADILSLCDGNLVFSKDLLDGIKSECLCPFSYYGIADDQVNYQEISWRNGKFDPNELSNQLATFGRAKHAFTKWSELRQNHTLAFCVSTRHADFMAQYFSRKGVKAVSVHSKSDIRRNEAIADLERGEIDIVFSVDLFNEGVDIPVLDTILMLRPTESTIIFLQQFGRGLRTFEGKEKLVVIDFIGNHISFFRKPEALFNIGVSNKKRKEFIEKIENKSLSLPPGCFVNYELTAIDFMKELTEVNIDQQVGLYRSLKETKGRRPTILEFYQGGGNVTKIRQSFGQWFQLAKDENDLTTNEISCLQTFEKFLSEVEVTNLTRSYKMVLLEAFLELEGFTTPPPISRLADISFDIIQKRPLLKQDLRSRFTLSELTKDAPPQWERYWRSNPINAWIGGNRADFNAFFEAKASFSFKAPVGEELIDTLSLMVKEIVDYRLIQYEQRIRTRLIQEDASPALIINFEKDDRTEIPFFSDLQIACGHFTTSRHDEDSIEYLPLPVSYGKLDPSKHFIARAKGNSMDGGRKPIKDGDYLLLELISSTSAGSISGQTLVIEQHNLSGDDQYLLRQVNKISPNNYELLATNPDYETIRSTEEFRTLARFKTIIDPLDIYCFQEFMREDIPQLFGLTFNTGLWQSGHVRPKVSNHQFLLVTLNKQGKEANHQYHDYFLDDSTFHWQSQRNSTLSSAKGQAIVNHQKNKGDVYLFVRPTKLAGKKAAPFLFCGRVNYEGHTNEKPMNVTWKLEEKVPKHLYAFLGIP